MLASGTGSGGHRDSEGVWDMENPDLQSVTPDELKIGMYVILPLSWHQHPFLKNHFLIQSAAEIDKIKELGTQGIQIDLSKSRLAEAPSVGELQASSAAEQQRAAQQVATADLITTIHDESLPPRNKSRLVRQHSITMMKNLLENPTAQNIREAQKGISEVVGLILTDDDTLHYLLDITSHDF